MKYKANDFESRLQTNLMMFAFENDIENIDDIDELNQSFIENQTLHELYAESDYVHINIPTGDDAIAEYEKAIEYVDNLDVEYVIKNSLLPEKTYLQSLLSYFKDIQSVYDKTDFVISNPTEISDLKIDNDAISGIFISSKEKYLLNKAIDKIISMNIKIDNQFNKLMAEYYDGFNKKNADNCCVGDLNG